VHSHVNLPILLAGSAAGRVKGGRHIKYAEPTPLANLHLTLLEKAGVPPRRVCRQHGDDRGAAVKRFGICGLVLLLSATSVRGAGPDAVLADAAERMDRAAGSRAAAAARPMSTRRR
jgi:hypothetical protein